MGATHSKLYSIIKFSQWMLIKLIYLFLLFPILYCHSVSLYHSEQIDEQVFAYISKETVKLKSVCAETASIYIWKLPIEGSKKLQFNLIPLNFGYKKWHLTAIDNVELFQISQDFQNPHISFSINQK